MDFWEDRSAKRPDSPAKLNSPRPDDQLVVLRHSDEISGPLWLPSDGSVRLVKMKNEKP